MQGIDRVSFQAATPSARSWPPYVFERQKFRGPSLTEGIGLAAPARSVSACYERHERQGKVEPARWQVELLYIVRATSRFFRNVCSLILLMLARPGRVSQQIAPGQRGPHFACNDDANNPGRMYRQPGQYRPVDLASKRSSQSSCYAAELKCAGDRNYTAAFVAQGSDSRSIRPKVRE